MSPGLDSVVSNAMFRKKEKVTFAVSQVNYKVGAGAKEVPGPGIVPRYLYTISSWPRYRTQVPIHTQYLAQV